MYCCNRCIEGKLLIHYYLCFVWRELIFKLPMTVKCVLKKRGWRDPSLYCGDRCVRPPEALLFVLSGGFAVPFLRFGSARCKVGPVLLPDHAIAQVVLTESRRVCVFSCVHSFALNITSPSWYRPCKHCILEQPPVCILLLIPVC